MLPLLAATIWFWTFSIGFLISITTTILSLFCPAVWWITIIYLIWIWIDRKTCERGGRPLQWIREWSWWQHVKDYFQFRLVSDAQLDKNKNYIFACFPHGMYPVGPFCSFVNGFQDKFPHHKIFTTALGIQFWMPIVRELFLAIGAVSVSAPSIKYLLENEKGGNIVSILIGGGDEAKYSKPGKYKIILNKRKGFVKMALQNGSPIVPVFTFGETDVFDQLDFPGFDAIRNIVKNVAGIGLFIPLGKYFICPFKARVTTVVGTPIEVPKIEKPTSEEIEELHQQFVNSIKKLFEEHKYNYIKTPQNVSLAIV